MRAKKKGHVVRLSDEAWEVLSSIKGERTIKETIDEMFSLKNPTSLETKGGGYTARQIKELKENFVKRGRQESLQSILRLIVTEWNR